MARVTQRVPPAALADLEGAPPRAALAFVRGELLDVLPASFLRDAAGRLWAGVDPGALPAADVPERAVLLVDDGRYWFELRAVTWRGRLAPGDAPPAASPGLRWLELVPERAAAWDYAALHEEPGP